jgi:hypothetical protein
MLAVAIAQVYFIYAFDNFQWLIKYQVSLGIATLLYYVPTELAATHQGGLVEALLVSE